VHQVQTDQAVLGVIESLRDGCQNRETEGLPQMDSHHVRLDNSVELNRSISSAASPVEDVLAQCPANASTLLARLDHEARGCDMRTSTLAVRTH
jgi:hypothetical protein